MIINPKEIFCGQPILNIRKVVRNAMNEKLWGRSMTIITGKVAKILKQSTAISKQVVEQLIREEYLIYKKEKFGKSIQYELEATDKGRQFGLASATAPISREKATQLLDQLIERAKVINSNKELVYFVESLKVFGSYLSDKDYLGDLDVGVKLTRRFESVEFTHQSQKRIELAMANGWKFSNFLDKISWPHTELMLMLKAGKKGLSLHLEEIDDVIKISETKLVYQYDMSVDRKNNIL
ncbi:MAG: hypothetical protein R6W78_13850 [Bacteroidales bacterium]